MKNTVILFLCVLLSMGCSVSQKTGQVNPFQGPKVGCGNFIVYKLSEDGTQYVSVALNAASVQLEETQTWSLQKADLLEVKWKKFDGDVSPMLCNDIMSKRPGEISNLVGKSGTVTVKVTEEDLAKAKKNEAYKVTLTLRKVVFEGLTVDYLQIENVTVGWLPG